jgi:ATP-dependent Clp protease ATP-binding subunit ClpC
VPIAQFIHWYFLKHPQRILARTWEYIVTFAEIFSFVFLLRTLLSPWRDLIEKYPNVGLDLGQISQAFVLNMTSRIIGMIIRLSSIIIGLIIELMIGVGGVLYFVLWYMYPAVLVLGAPVSLPFVFFGYSSAQLFFAFLVAFPFVIYRAVRRDQKDIRIKVLEEQMRGKEILSPEYAVEFKEWLHLSHLSAFDPEAMLQTFGAFGREWVMGYTKELDRLTIDLGLQIQFRGGRKTIVHTDLIADVFRIFSRASQHNVLLLGPQGAGKRLLAENIAFKIRKHEEEEGLPYTRLLMLRTEQLLSGTGEPDKALLDAISHLGQSEKVLFILQNLPLLLGSGEVKLKGVVTRILESNNIHALAVASPDDYHRLIKSDAALDSLFEKVQVNDTTEEETMQVLLEAAVELERKLKVQVTYESLESVIELTKRYVPKGAFPGKAIAILRDAVTGARANKDKTLTDQHVRDAVSLTAHMEVGEVGEEEKKKLLTLEDALTKEIIGQEEAVKGVVHALKRARLEIGDGDRPFGTFLFLGPTGVGKTHTAKTIAEKYFGDVKSLLRIDMNEYSTEQSVEGITGGGRAGGTFLMQKVQDHPFSLVLLDEIEKAHPKVLNLFLQVLDEGFMVDQSGKKTDFRNTIIIATSNAGALFIRDYIKGHTDWDKTEGHEEFKDTLIDTILKKKLFSPEFLNRFDETVVYYPLSLKDAMRVAILMLDGVVKEFEEKKGITLKVDEGVVHAIVEKGYSIEFGAREMRRTIVDVFENHLADILLKQDVKEGSEITIKKEDLELN